MSKLALVFAGGGGKGAYQIGVWKALKEYGVDENIGAIAGTSVGALNAVALLQGDYDLAENIWNNISHKQILQIDRLKLIEKLMSVIGTHISPSVINKFATNKCKKGFFSRSGLEEIIEKYINLQSISRSNIPCYITCCHIPTKIGTYFKLNGESPEKIKSIILASSALPVIFDSVIIDEQQYIDGGLVDNVPVAPLYEAGYRNFLVVHLGRDSIIETNKFSDAKIIQLVPQSHQGELIDGTLDFDSENCKKRIDQGYLDTKKILQQLYEMGMIQIKVEETLHKMQEDEKVFTQQREAILQKRQHLKDELRRMINNE